MFVYTFLKIKVVWVLKGPIALLPPPVAALNATWVFSNMRQNTAEITQLESMFLFFFVSFVSLSKRVPETRKDYLWSSAHGSGFHSPSA